MSAANYTDHCVIVGASHAGVQLALQLRREGWQDAITLVGDEPGLPYQRPPLSKACLLGSKTPDGIPLRPQKLFEQSGIELRLGQRVTAISRDERTVLFDDGSSLAYSKLALCTGTRARRLEIPGADLPGLHYLRTAEDANGIVADLDSASRAVIIGGGYIGLEASAALRKLGIEVTVLELAPRLLARVTSPEVSMFFERLHREEGVRVITGVSVAAIEGTDRVSGVRCAGGARFEADLVIAGIGVLPNSELAADAGLLTANGIVVDEFTRTSDHDIVAVGDVADQFSSRYGLRVRLESVQNATDQAKTAAATLCGRRQAFSALPWFWSEQYDVKIQTAGLSVGFDRIVVRGDPGEGRSFSAWYFAGDRLLAVDAVNDMKAYVRGRKLIEAGLSPGIDELGDPGIEPGAHLLHGEAA